ncbi:hypothetical protein C8Q80DRAFT_465351 [Daedaleopsis nitida]|nr:hypothetical protein C8Q80DRAFT_465351 [Daedaleopsis nitida]
MPSRSKRTPNVVVRPMSRGEGAPKKVVLATLEELNNHATADEITAHLAIFEERKPWKQASKSNHRYDRDWRMTRRNAGRDDGQTYVSRRFVCGRAVDPSRAFETAGGYEMDASREWERECPRREETDDVREHGIAEVAILDIAKPAKRRGAAKDYEVIKTLRRVIVLEDDEDEYEDVEWGWEDELDELDGVDWEAIEGPSKRKDSASYATAVKQAVR